MVDTLDLGDLGGGTGGITNAADYAGGGGLGSLFSNNPGLAGQLGAGLAGGVGMLLSKPAQVPYLPQLTGEAGKFGGFSATMGGQGQALIDPLISGNLPAGAEAQVQQALKAATNTTKARYASLGQTGSTMEGDALADLQNRTTAMRFQIAEEMAKTGMQASQLSLQAMGLEGQMWTQLMQAQMKQDDKATSAIGSFAKAIGGALGSIGGTMIGGPVGGAAGGAAGSAAGSAIGSLFS